MKFEFPNNFRVSADKLLAESWPYVFASGPDEETYSGSCPCCFIHGENFEVEIHCWRSNSECDCKYSGIHVSGSISNELKQKLAEHIRDNNGWSDTTDWEIKIL